MPKCLTCSCPFKLSSTEEQLRLQASPRFEGLHYPFLPPANCPECRYQQRLAGRNEWFLYRRYCSFSGRPMVSIYTANKPYPVYGAEVWWSDALDGLNYGRAFDFSRPFFEQFMELREKVPRLAITNHGSENCAFTNQSQYNRDCYLIVASNYSERCFYGNWYQGCTDCIDCYCLEQSQLCYECLNSTSLYSCCYVRDSSNCNFSWYCSDCHGCSNVFGSHGLRNKSYYWLNQPLSKHAWEEQLAKFLRNRELLAELQEKCRGVELSVLHKYYHGHSNEDFSGDYLQHCKSAYNAFNCRKCWDVLHVQDAWEAKSAFDLTETLTNEVAGSLEGCALCNFCYAMSKCWEVNDSYYCDLCFTSDHLFGCIGLKKNRYCILNKQYTVAEYDRLAAKIAAHMQETGEWGEHFPAAKSLFGYNESVAQEYFPMTREAVLARGWKWNDVAASGETEHDNTDHQSPDVRRCPESKALFKLLPAELNFYNRLQVPIPDYAPNLRRHHRYSQRNPRTLWQRDCSVCSLALESSYSPALPELIGCEGCYDAVH